MFNYMVRSVFYLESNVSFDEGGVAMRSRYCSAQQFNKNKLENCCVDFFIMAGTKYYFVYHMDFNQDKNKANININSMLYKISTTQKAVTDVILRSRIANDKDGSTHIYRDNRYTAPQLFALMQTNFNLREIGTYNTNRIGFNSDGMMLGNARDRVTYIKKFDARLEMVITR